MQDQGAAGGSAAGARSETPSYDLSSLTSAEKNLGESIWQQEVLRTKIVKLQEAKDDQEVKLNKHIESLKYEIDNIAPYIRKFSDLRKVHEDLRSEMEKLEQENASLKRSLLDNKPNLSEAEMDDLLKELEAAHVRLLKRRVRNEAMEKLKENPTFVCPISFQVFKYPVIVADGHTYERKDITKWISENRYVDVNRQYVWKSPMTGAHFRSTNVFPNIDKKTAIFNALEVAVDELVAKRRRINTPAP